MPLIITTPKGVINPSSVSVDVIITSVISLACAVASDVKFSNTNSMSSAKSSSVSIVGEVLNSATVGFNPEYSIYDYIDLAGGLRDSADKNKIFVILPNGKAQLIKKGLFSTNKGILPGSTIVISRDSKPFDAIRWTQIITPILADLATSAAAIAAISD